MKSDTASDTSGFSLIELLLALSLGLIVMASGTYLFSKALDATWRIGQRAEMQQNGRSAIDLMARDISLAGAGMPVGGVQLPSATGTAPKYGCDQVRCYVGGDPPSGIAFPSSRLYGVIPGWKAGASLSAGTPATDVVTVVYSDVTFALNLYKVTAFGANGTSITVAAPNPQPNPPVPQINDAAVGLKVGDLVLLSNNVGSAVGEVTGTTGTTVVNFADQDGLRINQSAAVTGNIKAISLGQNTVATRILAITYYVEAPAGPDGARGTADDLAPRLMRQVSGLSPVPVAENVSDLKLTYDIFDDTSNIATSNLSDAGLVQGKSPNQIRKVNITSLAMRSPLRGTTGFQGLGLSTSVSVRDMSFRDRYQ